jgi:hypothetical protein
MGRLVRTWDVGGCSRGLHTCSLVLTVPCVASFGSLRPGSFCKCCFSLCAIIQDQHPLLLLLLCCQQDMV